MKLNRTRLQTVSLAIAAATLTSACAPLIVGSAVGGAFMAADRRTTGMQVEDQTIKLKAGNRINDTIGNRGHINVNAYNRWVLLTGEVPTEADKVAVGQAVASVENVANVYNELMVSLNSSIGSRSSDVLLASKVRATLVDARDLMSGAFDVIVERGDVFLMGLATEREANRAAELAASVQGVNRVVKVIQIISEDELARRLPRPPLEPTPAK
jgi:osmotically-inducible protein OsmY